jgi:hypothetical protein
MFVLVNYRNLGAMITMRLSIKVAGLVLLAGAQVALVVGHGGHQGTWTHR